MRLDLESSVRIRISVRICGKVIGSCRVSDSRRLVLDGLDHTHGLKDAPDFSSQY